MTLYARAVAQLQHQTHIPPMHHQKPQNLAAEMQLTVDRANRLCAQEVRSWNRRFAGWILMTGGAYLVSLVFDPSWSLVPGVVLTMALWSQLHKVTVANEKMNRSVEALNAVCECQAGLLDMEDDDAA